MIYFVTLIINIASIVIYIGVARHYRITDTPNDRSSHSYTTIRGAGIIFIITVLFWYIYDHTSNPYFLYGLVLIGIISILDDIYTINSLIRFIMQTCSVVLAILSLEIFDASPIFLIIGVVLYVGWLNAYNFMDGINGITALYTLSILLPFSLISPYYSMPYSDLVMFLVISISVFMVVNVRKQALAFAGDIGSIALAFTLGYIVFELIVKSGYIEFLLFGSIYGVDSILTIIRRLIKRQNIFAAHRDHLYQALVNEKGIHFLTVGLLYSILQIAISLIIVYCTLHHPESLRIASIFILTLLVVLYLVTYKYAKPDENNQGDF